VICGSKQGIQIWTTDFTDTTDEGVSVWSCICAICVICGSKQGIRIWTTDFTDEGRLALFLLFFCSVFAFIAQLLVAQVISDSGFTLFARRFR
jgi:hypothetical protein